MYTNFPRKMGTLFFLFLILAVGRAENECKFTTISMTCTKQSGKFLLGETQLEIIQLYIIQSDLSVLTPEDFLNYDNALTVDITNSTLKFPNHNFLLRKISDLSELRITNCNVSDEVFTVFAANEHISHLILRRNKIISLKKKFFAHLKSVEQIDVSYNKISIIEIGTFDDLSNLRILNLTGNNIGEIFDPSFLILESKMCIVCSKSSEKFCSNDDFTRCKRSGPEDQLWWISTQVTIHLEENPICGIVSGKTPIKAVMLNSTEVDMKQDFCKVYEKGSCSQHERRRMFLFEACNISMNEEEEPVKQASSSSLLWFVIPFTIITSAAVGAFLTYSLIKNNSKKEHEDTETEAPEDNLPLLRDTRLRRAIRDDNLTEVQSLLSRGVNPNIMDDHGEYPLILAASSGNNAIINELMKRQVNIDARNSKGQTAIHVAIVQGHRETVNCLLNHGASITSTNKYGNTPLSQACKEGHTDIVRLLKNRGADIQPRNGFQETPIHHAARNGRLDTVKLLLEMGADIGPLDERGYTPLHLAARGGHRQIVELLLDRGESINVSNNSQNTPLHKAAKGGRLEVMKLLLERNADVRATNTKGQKPYDVAMEQGREDCAKLLGDHME